MYSIKQKIRCGFGSFDLNMQNAISNQRVDDITYLGKFDCTKDHHISSAIDTTNQKVVDEVVKYRCNKEISSQLRDYADYLDMNLPSNENK